MARIVYWGMSKKCGLPATDKWYKHEPERVVESDKAKLLWDFLIQTDHEIQSGKPNIVFLDKEEKISALLLILLHLNMPI